MVSGEMAASSPPKSTRRSTARHADAAAIGQYGKTRAGQARQARQRFGGGEQLVEIEHAQQAGAAKRGIVDRIGSGERAGVGHRGLGALRMPSRFDHQHRLGACRGARRRHEFARVLDRLDIEQDGARAAIQSEVIEQIGEVHVEAIADRDDGGKADAAAGSPLHQSGRDGARLRDERKIAGRRRRRREARIELCARHQHAETIGADQAHAGGAGVLLAGIGERAGAMAEPRGNDDADCGAFARGGGNRIGHRGRRHRDSDDIGRFRQRIVGFDGADARDLVVARIDQVNRRQETRCREDFRARRAPSMSGAATRRRRRRSAGRKAFRDDTWTWARQG